MTRTLTYGGFAMSGTILVVLGLLNLVGAFLLSIWAERWQNKADGADGYTQRDFLLNSDMCKATSLLCLLVGLDLSAVGVANPVIGLASLTIDNPLVVVMAFIVGTVCVLCAIWGGTYETRDEFADIVQLIAVAAVCFGIVAYAFYAHIDANLRGGLVQPFLGLCVLVAGLNAALIHKPWEFIHWPAKSRGVR